MGHCFHKGVELGPGDLNITLEDTNTGTRKDPYNISYTIFDFSSGVKNQIGPADRLPQRIDVGNYFAPYQG